MLVNIKVTGGLNIESGQIDPKATQGLNEMYVNIWAYDPKYKITLWLELFEYIFHIRVGLNFWSTQLIDSVEVLHC